MDLFKENNIDKATSYDFFERRIYYKKPKIRKQEKKILHKLSRSRIKNLTIKEIKKEL